MICCKECGKSDVALFRQNVKGKVGIWACKEHSKVQPDPVVEELVTIIEENNASNHLQCYSVS